MWTGWCDDRVTVLALELAVAKHRTLCIIAKYLLSHEKGRSCLLRACEGNSYTRNMVVYNCPESMPDDDVHHSVLIALEAALSMMVGFEKHTELWSRMQQPST